MPLKLAMPCSIAPSTQPSVVRRRGGSAAVAASDATIRTAASALRNRSSIFTGRLVLRDAQCAFGARARTAPRECLVAGLHFEAVGRDVAFLVERKQVRRERPASRVARAKRLVDVDLHESGPRSRAPLRGSLV